MKKVCLYFGYLPECTFLNCVSTCDVSVMQRLTDCNISLVCHCDSDINRCQKRNMVQWIQDKWKRVCVNRGLNHKGSVKIDKVQS